MLDTWLRCVEDSTGGSLIARICGSAFAFGMQIDALGARLRVHSRREVVCGELQGASRYVGFWQNTRCLF